MKCKGTDEIVAAFKRASEEAAKIARALGFEHEVREIAEAHILNGILLDIVWQIRKHGKANFNKALSKVKKALKSESRIKRLSQLCKLYLKLPWRNAYRIVDVGCGLGLNLYISNKFVQKGMLIGIDIDEYFLDTLRKILPEIHAVQADALNLPLRDGVADITFSTGVLHELKSLTAINELKRTLHKNGMILISDIVLRGIPAKLLNTIRAIKVKLGKEPETFYTLNQIHSSIEKAGLETVSETTAWKAIIGLYTAILRKVSLN